MYNDGYQDPESEWMVDKMRWIGLVWSVHCTHCQMWGSTCWLIRVPSICELTDILTYQTPLASYANMSTCHTSCDKCTSEHYDNTSAMHIVTIPTIVTATDYLTLKLSQFSTPTGCHGLSLLAPLHRMYASTHIAIIAKVLSVAQ